MENELGKTGRLAAIYATLTMAPATIILLIMDDFHEASVGFALALWLQAVFTFLWSARIQALRANIDSAQFSWSSNFMAIVVRCSAFLLFGLGGFAMAAANRYNYSASDGLVYLGVIFYSLQIPMIISSFVMGVTARGFIVAAIGYIIIFTNSFTIFGDLYEISVFYRVMTFIGVGVAVTGWFIAAAQLSKLEQAEAECENEEEEESADTPPETSDTPAESIYETKQQLMACPDEQLSYIVRSDNPYVSQVQRKAAMEILEKRRLWEQMKGLTDTELMDIVGNAGSSGEFTKADVASMELYSRRSPLFVSAVSSLSAEDIDDILANPEKYYDGYVMMASELAENK